MQARKARKSGKPYRGHAGSMYQSYLVTMADGTERFVDVPTAYGPDMARVAKLNAETQRS